ncbi:uncharacterized protein LOC141525876 [Cotesia typhae]|uniref:uncharacterized protein LOC141525876 n=1 Tax=Cotesia typhae TaxID=2053667 RepID=UPI003D69F096
MRFNAKVVVLLTTIVGVEWVRAAPPVTRCKEKCAGHHVIGVKISQTENKFQGVNVVGAEINQTENNFSSSGDGGNIEAAVIDQKKNNFDGAKDGGTASVHQHNNTCGGELIECGSSDCNIVHYPTETSR